MLLQKLYKIIDDNKLQGLILTDGYNINHISGYRGHTGCLLILDRDKFILTDSRYTEQVSIEAPNFICVDVTIDGYADTIKRLVDEKYGDNYPYVNGENLRTDIDNVEGFHLPQIIKLGFEDQHISYSQYKAFTDKFGDSVELVALGEEINRFRMIKSSEEIDLIAKAESIGDEAFNHIINFMEEGMTEKQVALELEYTMKSLGADGLSFDTIVASGPNSSLPHAVPTDRVISKGDFVTMDFGCIYRGYCSDMTRTVFMGDEINEEQLNVYTTVLNAQKAALKVIKPGVCCKDVDAVARDIIAQAGYGEYFGHGLGHGVGLYIHEEPRFSRKCEDILEPGMVITVEPGIYLPGKFGVRIEDLVVVTEDGYRNLTESPKVLILM